MTTEPNQSPGWLPYVVRRALRWTSTCAIGGWLVGLVPGVLLAQTDVGRHLVIVPAEIVLDGQQARQHVLAENYEQDRATGPADEVVWSVDDPAVAEFKNGIVLPRGDGQTVLRARCQDQQAVAQITVRRGAQAIEWEFRRHVLPVLSRAGCNQGACHGALAGKGGFRLSLRGYDPDGDFFTITQESRGRRLEPAQPGRSLFLSKPTGAVPHKGGLRLDVASRDYQVLADWIIAGATPPTSSDPVLQRLEVLPDRVALAVGQSQPLIVRAHYSDGRTEDVTDWAKFTSTQESVAQVDAGGKVRVMGPGEGAVSVWFSSQIAVARIVSPYPFQLATDVYDDAPRANFIDNLVLEKLRELRLAASPRSSDADFLRRVTIDLIGRLPTEEEAQAFLANPSPARREQWVDHLLSRSEYVDYWSYRWSDVLVISGRRIGAAEVKAYYTWLRRHVAQGTPWDQMVREIVTARGDSVLHGATNFYALHQAPEDMAESVSQAFLGLSINCAKCHNHPLEKWTNDQYYAMANLFARVRAKSPFRFPVSDDGFTISVEDRGDVLQPLTGKPRPPSPLDGTPLALDDPRDRREHLADWLTSADNPYFARAIANRVWANFMGTGLIEPIDDLRVSNPASNEQLLSALARYLVENDFDLRSLMRLIALSETYQRSNEVLIENAPDRRFYSRFYPRRIMAEVLLDAVAQITEVPDEFTMIGNIGMDTRKTDEYAKGTRALQLFDAAVYSPFLATFGRNPRAIVCECERSNTPTMVQALHLHNGDTINHRLQSEHGWLSRVLRGKPGAEELVRQAYWRVLSRPPTETEWARWRDVLQSASDVPTRELAEDIYWSLMSSREFLFQH